MKKSTGKIKPRSLIGIGLIIFAVLLFFDNIGLRFLHSIIRNWPIGMIIIGAVLIWGPDKLRIKSNSDRTLPFLLIGLGALFFIIQHGFLNFGFKAIIIPLVLLFVGYHIIRSGKHSNKQKTEIALYTKLEDEESEEMKHYDHVMDEDDKIDLFTILGGGDYSTRSANLTDGNIIAILGGVSADIREADTQQDVIEIDVQAILGGVELKVPAHWQVTVKVLPLLGGVSNKTTCLADKLQMKKKHLIVTGIAFMGGVDIRN